MSTVDVPLDAPAAMAGTWGVTGYRTHQLALPGASAARLAALRAQKDDDLAIPEALKPWRAGIPDEQLPAARQQWTALREDLMLAPEASPDRCRDFYLRTVQLSNALSRDDRVEVLEQALEAQPADGYRNVHRCLLSILAIHRGDLAEARAWLSDCAVDPPDILGDSAQRMAMAALAITEKDAETALHCLGDNYEAVTISKTFRALSIVYRAHALHLAGRRKEADAALDALVDAVGLARATDVVDQAPESWQVDRTSLERPVRAEGLSGARWRIAGAVLAVAAGVAALVAVFQVRSFDEDLMGVVIAIPVTFGLAAWLSLGAHRARRIAKHGHVGIGVVTGRSPSPWKSGQNRGQYLHIEARLGDDEVFARSLYPFGSATSRELLGKKVHVVWHPAYRDRALVYPRAR